MLDLERHMKWILPAFLAVDITFFLHRLYLSHRRLKQAEERSIEVLMFPDPVLYCKSHHFLSVGCPNMNCKKSHEVTSLVKLLRFLLSANTSVDVCMFNITCFDLADTLIDLRSRNIKVRIVTDSAELTGTQVPKLLNHGVPVRNEGCGFLMHHKFVVVDGKKLATGSFNWSQQAITGNSENILITNDKQSVVKYSNEFEKLWIKFKPALTAAPL